jgi:glutathione synthase/RimK-type ligase-like ATP-grasp enzyme
MQLPVINHPSKILQTSRDSIYRMLHDIPGLTVPETIRLTPRSPEDVVTEIDRAGLAFPVIVRLAGSHGGTSSILITGRSDLDRLHVYPFDGSDFYLTRFVDYVNDDGYYRKYRIVVIDGVPLYRHHMVDRKWMIHASSRGFMEENSFLMEESHARQKAFNEQTLPMIRPAIDEITRRLQLQYYGIDCNIDELGNILIFEVNANMNILRNNYQPLEEQIQRIRQHILKLLDKYAANGNLHKITRHG